MADMEIETLPKDILQFIEHNPDRAVEVLREIIDAPENAQGLSNLGNMMQGGLIWNGTTATATMTTPFTGGL